VSAPAGWVDRLSERMRAALGEVQHWIDSVLEEVLGKMVDIKTKLRPWRFEAQGSTLQPRPDLTSDHCQIEPRLRVLSIDRQRFHVILALAVLVLAGLLLVCCWGTSWPKLLSATTILPTRYAHETLDHSSIDLQRLRRLRGRGR
jgi:hypothetical protein